MKRPTVSLCVIMKNEERNLPRFIDSIAGCYDAVHFVDTGSTDRSREMVGEAHYKDKLRCEIYLHHFTWVDDFSAARNFAFEQAQTDYIAWLDLDDILNNAASFIKWRDSVMHLADFWLATYNYAFHAELMKPVCSFARERVIKRSLGLKWQYFVHEGIVAPPGTNCQYATTWTVDHLRGVEDLKVDRSRNLKLFEGKQNELDPRMQYYYGKELFENNQPADAFDWLMKACKNESLQPHDAILARQYACMAAQLINQYDHCIKIGHSGLMLDPNRAEFYGMIADAYIKKGQIQNAIPFYQAAKNCQKQSENALTQSAIFQQRDSYTSYPRNQLARAYFHAGNMEKAREELEETKRLYPNGETEAIEKELNKITETLPGFARTGTLHRSDDILISCHPTGFYEWDETIAKTRGIGGSETAVVHMARELRKITGRNILVYNNRTEEKEIDGVFYRNAHKLGEYVSQNLPAMHIAWRHNLKLTAAPTYLWCHDLAVPAIDDYSNYEKVLALSQFHKDYLHNLFRVPEDKIIVTRNGIDPTRFENLPTEKEFGKVVWSSSPDRGLDRAIAVMDRVVSEIPTASLHVYYGFNNLLINGKKDEVKRYESMIMDRPWIKYHGNVEQNKLARELATAEVWLYPTNFLETFFIGGLEMQACKVYGVLREWGAIPNTMATAAEKGMCTLIDHSGESILGEKLYADAVISAIKEQKWRNIQVDPGSMSWASVAEEWTHFLNISKST